MALSEHEQRLLDEMERNLLQHDTDVVAAGSARGALRYGWLALGILVGLVGLGLVVLGMVFQLPIVGIAGFAVMIVGVLLAGRRGHAPAAPDAPADGKPRQSFMSTLEDRWERRHDTHDEA